MKFLCAKNWGQFRLSIIILTISVSSMAFFPYNKAQGLSIQYNESVEVLSKKNKVINTPCPNPKKLCALCMYVGNITKDTDANGPYEYLYNESCSRRLV